MFLICCSAAKRHVNFVGKYAEDLFFDVVVVEEEREEIFVLFKTFYQGVVDVVEVGKLKIFGGVVLRRGFQGIGFHHDVLDLKHGFYRNLVVEIFAGATVDVGNDSRKQFHLVFRQTDVCQWQFQYRFRHKLRCFVFFLDVGFEIVGGDFAFDVETRARIVDAEIREYQFQKSILLVQLNILKTSGLYQKFVKSYKMSERYQNLALLFLGAVVLDVSFGFLATEGYLFSVLCRHIAPVVEGGIVENVVYFFYVHRVKHIISVHFGFQIVNGIGRNGVGKQCRSVIREKAASMS